ncbi:MAG: dTDP-glucose 4,6-dehydratase [Patescibacteria group bacterium]|nr:dTDP-glucose 4,6-dehydratase [Patescibacteria group bacterium]
MRIFVCGGAGFIGSNFIRYILGKHKNVQILNYDALTYSGNLNNLKDIEKDKRHRFIKGNIADKETVDLVFQKFKPDYVINFAAETHVDRSIHIGAKEFIDTNITGVFNILEAVKARSGVKKYVQVSTDEVYGSLPLNSKNTFKEDTAFAPNVPYAATKAGGDMFCRAYYNTFKTPVIVTHCSNNYGPYQYPEKLIPFFILRMLENKKLPLYGDGKNVRDWIYVLDHCEALRLCLFKGKPGEVYNIGADNEMSNLEIASLILNHFNRDKSWMEFVTDRPGHDRRYAIDSRKIRKELGWKPKHQFKKVFTETIHWYLKNEDWINNVREKTGVFNPHIDLWEGHKMKK